MRSFRDIIEDDMLVAQDLVQQRLVWLVSLETHPFTSNTHYFSSYRVKFLTKYRGDRTVRPICGHNRHIPRLTGTLRWKSKAQPRMSEEAQTEADDLLARLRALGYGINSTEDFVKLAEADPFEQEMIVAAEVRAYFQVAYKVNSLSVTFVFCCSSARHQRLADIVPLVIDHDFVAALGARIHAALITQLEIGSKEGIDRAERLLAED